MNRALPFSIVYPLFHPHPVFDEATKAAPPPQGLPPFVSVGSSIPFCCLPEKYLFSEVFVVYSGNEDRPFESMKS